MLNDATDRVYPELDHAELFAVYQAEQEIVKKEIQRQKDIAMAANAAKAQAEKEEGQQEGEEEVKEEIVVVPDEEVKEPPMKRAKMEEVV